MDTFTCMGCDQELPTSDFYPSTRNKRGHLPRCKQCKSDYHQEWKQRDPEKRARQLRNQHLVRTFGITADEFDAKLEAQGGRCAICGSYEPQGPNWHLDHDHDTKKLRDLLCFPCNVSIGHLGDSSVMVDRAADYLRRHGK